MGSTGLPKRSAEGLLADMIVSSGDSFKLRLAPGPAQARSRARVAPAVRLRPRALLLFIVRSLHIPSSTLLERACGQETLRRQPELRHSKQRFAAGVCRARNGRVGDTSSPSAKPGGPRVSASSRWAASRKRRPRSARLNGTKLAGRNLTVNEARQQESRGGATAVTAVAEAAGIRSWPGRLRQPRPRRLWRRRWRWWWRRRRWWWRWTGRRRY